MIPDYGSLFWATLYTGKIGTLHQSKPLRVTFPDRENYFPRSTNVQPVFDIVPMSKLAVRL